MKKTTSRIRTALVPINDEGHEQALIALAQAVAEKVILVGIVAIAAEDSISAGVQQARRIRRKLFKLSSDSIHPLSTVIVSKTPWIDLQSIISSKKPDLIFIEWQEGCESFGTPISEILARATCNISIIRAAPNLKHDRILIAARGGPYAELALRVGLNIPNSQMDVIHVALENDHDEGPFLGLKNIIPHLPEVNLRSITTDDIALSILNESAHYDLVILGATASSSLGGPSIGPVALKLLKESPSTVMIVNTPRRISESISNRTAGSGAISILVDKWFAENTFHAKEFADLERLLYLKEQQSLTISLAMPALNEEKTVGKVISVIKAALMDEAPLLDEMVLLDSDSTDQTRQIAENLGIPVYIHQQLLPELGARSGKGEALWKSLLVTRGDIIAWIDTDITNIHPRFIYGIIGPLLFNQDIQFVKGFYRRPLKVGDKIQAGGGGRVTELVARPLINLFYPELSGIVQPLAGEYAGRRKALENAVFFSGYGVEIGLLIDIFEKYGLYSIAQVDLLERIHRNQELESLSKMSFAIIQAMLRKLESRYERAFIEDINKTMKLIRRTRGEYSLELGEIAELERPPIINLPAYQQWKNR